MRPILVSPKRRPDSALGGGIAMRSSLRALLLLSSALSIFVMSELPASAAQASEAGSVPTLPPVPQSDPFFGIVQAIHDPFHAVNAGARWERLVLWWSNVQPEGPGAVSYTHLRAHET